MPRLATDSSWWLTVETRSDVISPVLPANKQKCCSHECLHCNALTRVVCRTYLLTLSVEITEFCYLRGQVIGTHKTEYANNLCSGEPWTHPRTEVSLNKNNAIIKILVYLYYLYTYFIKTQGSYIIHLRVFYNFIIITVIKTIIVIIKIIIMSGEIASSCKTDK